MTASSRSALAGLAALTLATSIGSAQAETFRGDYSLSLWGLTIGRSSFKTSIEGDRIKVDGSLSSAGLARVFDSTTGTVSLSGRVRGSAVQPSAYRVAYTSGKRSKSTAIDFRGGAVARTDIKPAPRKRDADSYIALDKGDLNRVVDPLTASLIKAESLDDVCRQTLRVYDGASRMDFRLSPAGKEPIEVDGYKGDAITCTAAFKARSGYKRNDRSVKHLENQSNIRIAFAPLGETGVYAPIGASVDTSIGTVTLTASRYGPE